MEPELTKLMMDERDPDVLKWAWKGWRDVTGKNMKSLYTDLIKLLNKGADDNGMYRSIILYGISYKLSQKTVVVLYIYVRPIRLIGSFIC